MYISSLHIEKHQILEDLKITFEIPKDSKNIVNIIAGVNGSGKTTLLKWILSGLNEGTDNGSLIRDGNMKMPSYEVDSSLWGSNVGRFQDNLRKNNAYKEGVHSSPRVIFIPSNMTFEYRAESNLDTSYSYSNTIDTNSLLGNAEFFIKDYIISKERLSNKGDSKERTKDAIDSFNSIFSESELITKLVNLDIHNSNKPIFKTLNGDTVTIDKLSSGEQQLYARVVSLMILNPHNSVILIDEPEIALHPKWQIEIMKIYANIGKNNQFIVTTHSPFIIAQTPYKNLTFLLRENDKIVAKQFTEAPLDRDLNTIVKTIMGADYMPKELSSLHDEYRAYLDNSEEESPQAKELKDKILEYESPNSSFFQSIAFEKELMQ